MDLAMIILLVVDALLLIGVILCACLSKKNKTPSSDNVIYVKEVGKIVIDTSDKVYAVVSDEKVKVAEQPTEVVEEVAEEPTAEVVEEIVEEPTAEVVEEVAEEPTAEVVEEIAEEPTAEVVEEVAEEPAAEVVEEVAEEPTAETEEIATAEDTEELEEAEDTEEAEEVTVEELFASSETENTEGNKFSSLANDSKPLVPFSEKLINSDDRVKLYYNEIRNQFKSYKGINARLSKRYDTFRKGRELIAKITFAGKTMKIYLKMNPNNYDPKIYHHKDASDKKSYKEVPMMLRIKSDRTYKHVINLIDELMVNEGVEPKKKYEDVNYLEYVTTLQNME